jgi:hypothetical protein
MRRQAQDRRHDASESTLMTETSSHPRLPPTPSIPSVVLAVAAVMVLVLLLLAPAYGFHGDEMYYVVAGQHPAFGYVDQPPLTPLLSAASAAFLGVSPLSVRVLPALEMALVVVIVALIARDLGGTRRSQVIAAVVAAVSGYLATGHLDTTTDPDLLAWAVVLWLLVRLFAGADRRLWLVVGLVAGVALENKNTILFLGAGLAVGLVVARRWDLLRSPWAWAAIGIAILLWLPNLAWQATNGWPQLEMARAIASYANENRAQVIPLLWLFTGPLLFPISITGLAWILFARNATPWRAIGIGALVALGLALVSGGKAYYAIGSAPVFMAAGAIVVDRWLVRGHAIAKGAALVSAAVLSGAFIALVTLPVLPVDAYAKSGLPEAVPDVANTIGWPAFVATVQDVVDSLPPDQRNHAVILANDYSEASALELLGSGLPPVYSGHNGYWSWGPPAADRTVAIHVGDWRPTDWRPYFRDCTDRATVDNGLGVENGEQGTIVSVCTGLSQPWSSMWPALRTIS